jgi:gliding motility-associated lipoprotein GldH
MKRVVNLIVVFIVFICLFSGCDKRRFYEDFHTIPSSGWMKDSVEIFQFVVFDIKQKYNININIRNDINYKFSNLWLFIDIVQPDGSTKNESFEIILAQPDGKWMGKGIGGVKTLQSRFHQNFLFPFPGIYKFKINHGMRDDLLKGITDIGFRVEKI